MTDSRSEQAATMQDLFPPLGPPIPGNDPAVPTACQGFRLNHTMLQIGDPQIMVPFYTDVLGFRRVMTLNNGPCFVYYFAYYKTETSGQEVFNHMQERDGLLELVHIKGVATKLTNSMGHIGITVPDIKAAEKRFKRLGVEIHKPLGIEYATKAAMCIPEEYWGVGPDLTAGFKKVFGNMMMIKDPEGNFIEVVPHHAG